ncbi:hypothetical protein BDF20DRAFT_799975, partial [Mycotypha africana]|uniref:uncharacterized protein n=1 Tax=Mycotypha africana TaxID=64632 RepID=UPI00230133B3
YFSSPYPTMSVREKRLTADTLVDETSSLMLKKQYSPQLAFSPSLSADGGMLAVQQQQQSDLSISPSNTLIDNA